MKRILIYIFIITVVFTFFGCEKIKERTNLTAEDFIAELEDAEFPIDDAKIIKKDSKCDEKSSVEFNHKEGDTLITGIIIEVFCSADEALDYKEYLENLSEISASFEMEACEVKYNFAIVFPKGIDDDLEKTYINAFKSIISREEVKPYDS